MIGVQSEQTLISDRGTLQIPNHLQDIPEGLAGLAMVGAELQHLPVGLHRGRETPLHLQHTAEQIPGPRIRGRDSERTVQTLLGLPVPAAVPSDLAQQPPKQRVLGIRDACPTT
jgi:hypothetical protein